MIMHRVSIFYQINLGFSLIILSLLHSASWALSLENPVTMNFGKTDFALPLSGALALGTDGTIAYSGVFNGAGLGSAGQIRLQDAAGTGVEIACNNGVLAHQDGSTLALEGNVVMGAAAVGPFTAGALCQGLNTVLFTHTLTSQEAENILFLGGRLAPTALHAGGYSTTHPGGSPLGVRAMVQ